MNLENIFKYHSPINNQAQRYEQIRAAALEFAQVIDELCPDSDEKVTAIRNLQTAAMFANASIALNEFK
jgi:hypothetical protein